MKKIRFNHITIIFFFLFFVLGLKVCADYLVTPDEPLHRINGFISLKYIVELFSINLKNTEIFNEIPNLYNDWRKTYGVAFDLPLSLLELLFNLNIENSFLLRHYLNFLIFFTSVIYFFILAKRITKNEKLAFLGVLILVSTPRIFSHSFYNSKDIIFLSLFIISIYYLLELINKFSYKKLFLSCLFCALASNIRIIGIFLPFLTIIFYYFLDNKYKIKKDLYFVAYLIFLYFFLLYFSWPFLWESPIKNLLSIIKESSSYPNHWNFKILYLGKYINPETLPWHYFFIWFFSTTPVLFIMFIIYGIVYFLKKYLPFFLKINFSKNIQLWKNREDMNILFLFLCFFIPLFIVITLNSTLYNGWRHLFFIYPVLIIISLFGLKNIFKKFTKYIIFIPFLISLQLLSNFYFIYKSHPVQNVYFNFISKPFIKGNLPIDYWGLGNKTSIDFLVIKKNTFNISSSSFTPLSNLKYSNKKDFSYSENIKFLGTQKKNKNKSDFIFTNFYYNRDPKNVEKFKIPKNYKSYYKLKIDGIVVNEVFAK